MSLAAELSSFSDNFYKTAPPPVSSTIKTVTENFKKSYDPKSAIQVGEPFPAFRLQNALGKEVASHDLLSQGPLVIAFYRGEWCPYCNLELRALQKHLDEIKAKGVNLVAISPELPDTSLTTTEKNELSFPVLSDVGNKLTKQLGILFEQPEVMGGLFKQFGTDMKKRNGDESLEVPVPATFLVDKDGIVRNAFIDADYTKRLEPSVALQWIDELRG